MSLIYRAMTRVDDRPLIAPTARGLGARPGVDIAVNDSGNVAPGTGGMSVVPHWKLLAPWRIPKRLAATVPEARGRNEDACWRRGEGGFTTEQIGEHLHFVPDQQNHGLVEPVYAMPLETYQTALANTQDDWIIDEY